MAISEADARVLFSLSAGICSRPSCGADLVKIMRGSGKLHIAEMAHIIGRRPAAARSGGVGGPDTYENLVLLCPSCHTEIDKNPNDFSVETLHEWKATHEARIQTARAAPSFLTFEELRGFIAELLLENGKIFNAFGPKSAAAREKPASNLADTWDALRLSVLLPNNSRISSAIKLNRSLLPKKLNTLIADFESHRLAFEEHVLRPVEDYPTFPEDFAKEFLSD